jgi:RNA polymerase sigma-70 factor (ECF subfamily)
VQFRGDADIGTWLAKVTINRCRTLRRRRLLTLKWLSRQRSATPAEAELADDTSAHVRAAVQALPTRDREVIVLFYLGERSVKQIAELLDSSSGAVEVRLHRARRKLKAKLGELMND